MPSFFFAPKQGEPQAPTSSSVKRQHKMADSALEQGASMAPVQGGPIEAMARMLTAGIGGYNKHRAREADAQSQMTPPAPFGGSPIGGPPAGGDPWGGMRQPDPVAQAKFQMGDPAVNAGAAPAPDFLGAARKKLFGY